MICLRKCPTEAITGGKNRIHVIDQENVTVAGPASRFALLASAQSGGFLANRFHRQYLRTPEFRQREYIAMSEILIQIDGKEVKATEGMTILEASSAAGILYPYALPSRKTGILRGLPDLYGRGGN